MSEEEKNNSVEENETAENIEGKDGAVFVSEDMPESSESEAEAAVEVGSEETSESSSDVKDEESSSEEPDKEETPSEPEAKPTKPLPKHKKYQRKRKAGILPEKEYLPDFPFDFKTVLLFLFAISMIVFIWSLIFHPSMRIETITINGNYEFSDEEILDALNIHVGDHVLKPTLFNARALEESTPYIDDIDVRLDFPSAIVINVVERHRLAYIKVPDGYAVIDQEGMILDFSTFVDADVHPVLCGLDLDSVVIGQRTDITDSLKFRKMILVLGAVLDAERGSIRDDGYNFYDSVQEIRVVASGLIFLTVELPDGTELQVKLDGVENIDENMQWLLYAIRADAFEGLPAGSLDMTEEEKIYRAYSS